MTSLSKPMSVGFGLRVDGRDTGISFATAAEAEGGARRLTTHGYRRIDIFDRISGNVVEHVAPDPKLV